MGCSGFDAHSPGHSNHTLMMIQPTPTAKHMPLNTSPAISITALRKNTPWPRESHGASYRAPHGDDGCVRAGKIGPGNLGGGIRQGLPLRGP